MLSFIVICDNNLSRTLPVKFCRMLVIICQSARLREK
nr:MAG TPA: hypothetical protein [Caudoviricetes sp.]